MSPDEVHEAALTFLDQFIERGAAADILTLRERLASEPEARRRLAARLANGQPSEREAYDAMAACFAAEYDLLEHERYTGGPPDLAELIVWMSWDISPAHPSSPADQTTSDPAQWHDWLASVESRRSA